MLEHLLQRRWSSALRVVSALHRWSPIHVRCSEVAYSMKKSTTALLCALSFARDTRTESRWRHYRWFADGADATDAADVATIVIVAHRGVSL
jgi:hypothetical protein